MRHEIGEPLLVQTSHLTAISFRCSCGWTSDEVHPEHRFGPSDAWRRICGQAQAHLDEHAGER